MERKAKTIPNITEMAVRKTRQYMRYIKDNGTYMKRRRTFSTNIFTFMILKAYGAYTERDAVFNEVLEAVKSAYMSTGLNRFNAIIPKDKREIINDACARADNGRLDRNGHPTQQPTSYNIYDIVEWLERKCVLHNRLDSYDPIHTTMVTVSRIINSRLMLTAYLNYPRIRRVLETYKHVHIKTEEI